MRFAQSRTCLKEFPKATTVRAFWSRLALQRLMLLRGTTIIARSAIGYPDQAKAKSQQAVSQLHVSIAWVYKAL